MGVKRETKPTYYQLDDERLDMKYNHIKAVTKKAYLLDLDGDGTRKIWVPKSQVELNQKTCTVNIPRWLAIKKGLI